MGLNAASADQPGAGDLQLRRTRAQLALLALVLTAVRLAFAGAIHLTEDEAYYRLWAQHPQAGYLDHPPMIAWWIHLGMGLVGDTALGGRLLPCLATGVGTWLIGDTALRLGLSGRTSLRASLWWNATLTIALGGLLATPDTPACFFWTLCIWCLAHLRRTAADAPWWIGAGLAAGLGCLSKYSALFLAPGVFLWLALTPYGLRELRRPWPWLAAAAAALAFLPNIAWNATHDWLTFDKQFGRVGGDALRLELLPEFLLTQFLLLNPLVAIIAARGAPSIWRGRREAPYPGVLLPIAAATPFLLYLAAHSLHDRVQGHWPVPIFGAVVLAAALAAEARHGWPARLVPVVGLGLAALALAYLAIPGPGLFGPADPRLALHGWETFARDVEALRRREGAAWVSVQSYGLRSQLATETAVQTPLVQVVERDRWFDWDAPPDFTRPGLLIDLDRRLPEAEVRRCFAVVTPAGVIDRAHGGGRWTRYTAYRVQGPMTDLMRRGCAGLG